MKKGARVPMMRTGRVGFCGSEHRLLLKSTAMKGTDAKTSSKGSAFLDSSGSLAGPRLRFCADGTLA